MSESVCGHVAFLIPRDVGLTIDVQRDWDRLQRYEQHCILPRHHEGDHEYE